VTAPGPAATGAAAASGASRPGTDVSGQGERAPTASIGDFGYRQELKRSLSLTDLLMYGLVLISPTAVFPSFGIIYNLSAGMVPLVYVIGLVAMFFTALSYMAMSQEYPLAGSAYAYARGTFGDGAGFIAGWAVMLDYLLTPALIYIAAEVALDAVFPGVPLVVWGIGLLVLNTVINLRGIDSITRANTGLLLLQLAALALFLVFAVVAVARGTAGAHLSLQPFYNAGRIAPEVVLGAVSIGVLNYLGFDAISTLAEEARGGPSLVARATLLTLLITAVLFVAQSYLASLFVLKVTAFPPGKAAYAAFYTIAQSIGGVWFKGVLSISCLVLAGIASALTAQAAIARLIFSMARDGRLPRPLAHVDPRRQVPDRATVLVAIVTAALILFFSSRLELLLSIVSFGAMTAFLFVHASVVKHFFWRQGSRDWWRHLIAPGVGFAIIVFVMFNMSLNSKRVGLTWIALGILILLVRKLNGRGSSPV
jgi:amino acid transporter